MNNKGQISVLSIVAFILSLLGITSLIGVALGIVDLRKRDGRNTVLSIIAIVLGSIITLIIARLILVLGVSALMYENIIN